MTRSVRSSKPLIVMQSVPELGGAEQSYVDHMSAALSAYPDLQMVPFSYRAALIGRWDVLHVHWPEFLLRSHLGRRSRWKRRFLFALVLARVRLRHKVIVRTVHNVQPHERARGVENALLALLDRSTDLSVRLNPVTDVAGRPTVTILHPHYRELISHLPAPAAEVGLVAFFGFIRSYKGIEEMVDAFRSLSSTGTRLVVAGKPADARTVAYLETAQALDERISTHLGFQSESDLVRIVARSSLVVLPYPNLHNSGVLLYALSVGRPVLVVKNAATDAIRDEVGAEWVHQFEWPIDGPDIAGALELAEQVRGRRPALPGRTWGDTAAAYRVAFNDLQGSR